MTDPIQTRLKFTHANTMACSKLALKWFRTDEADPEQKADGSPVTVADRAIETELRRLIADAFPDDAIRGEELPDTGGTSGYEWVIDPIDGTVSFVHGVPLFGTMIAVLKDGVPTIGAIAMPCLDEMVIGATGHGAIHIREGHPDTPLHLCKTDTLEDALVVVTAPKCFMDCNRWSLYEQVVERSRVTRGWSDCYAFMLVVTGRADAVVEAEVNLWDLAPVPPLIQEAGGCWSDFDGDASVETGTLICGSAGVHAELLALTQGSRVG